MREWSRFIYSYLRYFIIFLVVKIRRKKFDEKNNVYVFADPRGGSTWLMQILQGLNKSAVIWEPYHNSRGLVPATMNLCNVGRFRPQLPEGASWPELKNLMLRIFRGEVFNRFTVSINFSDYFRNDFFIVKFIRGNAVLPWLVANIEFHKKPILLLRHPCAVARSQISAFRRNKEFEKIGHPRQKYSEIFEKNKEFLDTLESEMEAHVALWCIHNAETIRNPRFDQDWIVVYYENLLMNPKTELTRLFSRLNMELTEKILSRITRRSKTDFHNELQQDTHDQLSKWLKGIDEIQQNKIQRILDYFDVKIYNAYSSLPQK